MSLYMQKVQTCEMDRFWPTMRDLRAVYKMFGLTDLLCVIGVVQSMVKVSRYPTKPVVLLHAPRCEIQLMKPDSN